MSARVIISVIGAAILVAGCSNNEMKSIATGMSERHVRQRLGAPTEEITELEDMTLYIHDEDCKQSVAKLLIYDRWGTDDIFVAFDNEKRVLCVEGGLWLVEF